MSIPRDPIEIAREAIEKALTSNKSAGIKPSLGKTVLQGDKARNLKPKNNTHKKTPQ